MPQDDFFAWFNDFLRYLIDQFGRGLNFAEIQDRYPEIKRTTLLSWLQKAEKHHWVERSQYGYGLDQSCVALFYRMQKASSSSLGEANERAKLEINRVVAEATSRLDHTVRCAQLVMGEHTNA